MALGYPPPQCGQNNKLKLLPPSHPSDVVSNNYHPHSKGMREGNVFTGVCPFTGDVPQSQGSFPGVRSLVLCRGYPSLGWTYPSLSQGYPSSGWGEVPQFWLGGGTPVSGWGRYPSPSWGYPGQDWGYPPARTGLGTLPLPPPPPRDRTAEQALAT